MQLTVLGGCNEQGRACFAISFGDTSVMLDCGVKRRFAPGVWGEYPDLEAMGTPRALVLSHAHEDHSAALPVFRRLHPEVPVLCALGCGSATQAYFNAWLGAVMRNSGEAPFTLQEAQAVNFIEFPPDNDIPIDDDTHLFMGPSGHLPAGCWIGLRRGAENVLYTGDICFESAFLKPPTLPHDADLLIVDAAYGVAEVSQAECVSHLREVCCSLRGRQIVLLPLPRVGRGQEVLSHVADWHSTGLLAGIQVYVEARLVDGLDDYESAPEYLSTEGLKRLEKTREFFSTARTGVNIVRSVEPASMRRPCLVLAGDAMLSSGESSRLFEALGDDPEMTVVLTGHQAEGTAGHLLLTTPDSFRSNVVRLPYKVHPSWSEVLAVVRTVRPKLVVPVHCDAKSAAKVQARLTQEGLRCEVPKPGETVCV